MASELVIGQAGVLSVEWHAYSGGPLTTVTGVTVQITPAAGGAAVLGPTSTGVVNPSTGVNTYAWTPSVAAGDYLVTWSGTDVATNVVTATELVSVVTATDLYTDLTTAKSALGKLTADDRDDLIEQAIKAASRLIDRRTGRRFYADTVATTRTFGTAGKLLTDGTLLVDDISSTTGLAVEYGTTGNWTTLTGWEADDVDNLARGWPITRLTGFAGYSRVRITALWGWPAVPDEIAQAALLLTTRLYRRKDSPQGVLGSAEWGLARVSRVDPDVEALIEPYSLPGFA